MNTIFIILSIYKNHLIRFLRETYYADRHEINTYGKTDLVIHNNKTAKSPVGVLSTPQIEGQDVKLNCQLRQAQIKIEVNTTTRGHIYPVRLMQVKESVQESFGKFAAIKVVSHAELFGSKICAALDRQHPRDLFDIHHLLENEGFTDDIRIGFLVYLLSHARPINEVIHPHFLDQRSAFDTQFAGITATPFTYGKQGNG